MSTSCASSATPGWTETPFTGDDIASQFDTRNSSFHAVETSTTNSMATSGSFVTTSPAWTNSSVLYCIDCHGNSDVTEPQGPHSSQDAPLLSAPYRGATPDTAEILCYECHKYTVYASGGGDDGPLGDGSNFYDSSLSGDARKLHHQHTYVRGFGCESCHVSHGTAGYHLIRPDIGWSHVGTGGGSCTNGCHSTGASTPELHSY